LFARLEQFRREIEPRHAGAQPCRRDRDDPGSARDVERAHAAADARVQRETRSRNRRKHLQRREEGPSRSLRRFELIQRVHPYASESTAAINALM
jgi:hypothetical protein